MECKKCNDTGRVEVLDSYFEYCTCQKAKKEERDDLIERKRLLGIQVREVKKRIKEIKENLQ